MNILLLLLIIAIMVITFITTFRNTKYNKVKCRRNIADNNLENLYKIQNYEFWRDFGKQGETNKK